MTAFPATGYHFVSWSDGSTANPRTDTNVTADLTVTANFAIDTYTITASAGTGGAISPSGVTTLNYGGSQSYTITPNSGYLIVDVTVDSVSMGPISGYSFTAITDNHTISATFEEMIDRTVWSDLEVVRRINNGVLESELRRYGSNGSNYLVFYNSGSVNSFSADVTVKAYANNGSYPHASLLGYAYNDGTQGDGILETY